MTNLRFQRDEFITEIYKRAKKNKNIYFLSADFGAPALDQFRENLKNQFVHLGISEQNMVDFANGLALEGKKVYIYAMAPFLSLRCIEQHKTATCLMGTNVCSIVTGIGLSYANSGPTHYSTEDFACLRSLSNCYIYTASDPLVAKYLALKSLLLNKPTFIRLDRKASKNLHNKVKISDIENGYSYLHKGKLKKLLIISHGSIIERAKKAINLLPSKKRDSVVLLDLFQAKPFPKKVENYAKKFKNILTIDEQTISGSLGSLIKENVNRKNIISLALPDRFIFENTGREKLLDDNNLSVSNIRKNILKLI
jgi:transketolase